MTELDSMSILDVERAIDALRVWEDAEAELYKSNQ